MSTAFSADRLRHGLSAPLTLLAGLATLVVGGLLIVAPQQAAQLIVLLLAVVLIVKGLATVVEAGRQADLLWGWRALAGVVALVAGLVVLATLAVSTLITVIVAYYVLAGGLVIGGVLELASGVSTPRSWWAVILGILQIVLAVLVMFFPTTGAVIMLQFAGAFVVAMAIVLIASSLGRS